MRRSQELAPGEFYHVYNRGTDKREVFLRLTDYERFVSLLYLSNSTRHVVCNRRNTTIADIFNKHRDETLVDICAYCLMPNHFHILIKEKEEAGMSKFMHKLTTSYAMYFNKKYDRTGTLFEGRYKTQHVNTDIYLKYLLSYIHLNPLKIIEPLWKEKGVENREVCREFLEAYTYSSFLDYMDIKRPENAILNKNALPEYFASVNDFQKEMYEWFDLKEEV